MIHIYNDFCNFVIKKLINNLFFNQGPLRGRHLEPPGQRPGLDFKLYFISKVC